MSTVLDTDEGYIYFNKKRGMITKSLKMRNLYIKENDHV